MRNKILPALPLISIILAMTFSGCSVKEDRSACPLKFALYLAEADSVRLPAVLAVFPSQGAGFTDTLRRTGWHSVEVSEGALHLMLCSGSGSAFSLDGLRIRPGSQCPPAYLYIADEFVELEPGEAVRDTVSFHKEYARIGVTLTSGEPLPERIETFHLEFLGDVCGYDVRGLPVSGSFSCPVLLQGGRAELLLPRQRDASLRMDVTHNDGSLLRSFAIGEYLESCGYDWNARDLEDLEITLNLAATSLTISTSVWEKTISFEILI